MIAIDRNLKDETGEIIRPNANWFKSADLATVKAVRDGPPKKFRQDLYAHSEVKQAAEAISEFQMCVL